MIGKPTLRHAMAQGAWRKNRRDPRTAAIDARMGEVYWAEYQRDAQGVWQGEETVLVLKPERVGERLEQLLSKQRATVERVGPGVARSGEGVRPDASGDVRCRSWQRKICCPSPSQKLAAGEHRCREHAGAGLFA